MQAEEDAQSLCVAGWQKSALGRILCRAISWWDICLLLDNISVDEWPQVLLNDRAWSKSIRFADYGRMAELHYILMQGNLKWLKKYIKLITWDSAGLAILFPLFACS